MGQKIACEAACCRQGEGDANELMVGSEAVQPAHKQKLGSIPGANTTALAAPNTSAPRQGTVALEVAVQDDSPAGEKAGELERSSEADIAELLGWRQAAVVPRPPAPVVLQLGLKGFLQRKRLVADGHQLTKRVTSFLGDVAANHQDLPMAELMKPGADWSGFAHLQLSRVQAISDLGGPRMKIVSWRSLAHLGRLPKFPDDRAHVLDAEELLKAFIAGMDSKGKVEGRIACLSMFSHCWERPDMDPLKAHPDTPDNKKAAALAHYGKQGVCPYFEPHHKFDYYFWFDFAGIHQTCSRQKYLGIVKLPAIVAACTEMVFYWSSTGDYEPRAWTRIERMLGFCFTISPLFVFISDSYPNGRVDAAQLVADAPEVFVADPEVQGGLCMLIKDPFGPDAQITDVRDKEFLRRLMDACGSSLPINPQMKGMTMGSVEFGKTFIRVDTEHFRIDAEAEEHIRLQRRALNS